MNLCLASQERVDMENHSINQLFLVDKVFVLIFTSLSLLFFSCNCAAFFFFRYSFHSLFCILSSLPLPPPPHMVPLRFLSFIFWLFSFSILLIKSIAHVTLFSLFPFPFFFSFLPNFLLSQHWNTGGGHAEELERPGAHPRLKTRPQPPLFHPSVSSEPQFTDCVALPEHSISAVQIALQMSIMMTNYQ